MQSKLDYVINGWDTYRNVFVESEGNDQSSSLSLLFNHFLFDYEQLKRNKFALPSGLQQVLEYQFLQIHPKLKDFIVVSHLS